MRREGVRVGLRILKSDGVKSLQRELQLGDFARLSG